jgi:hypothetical protein
MLESLRFLGGFDERDYLNHLRENLPRDVGPLLESALGADLALSSILTLNDFLYPLTSGRFPAKNLIEYRWILGETKSAFANENVPRQLRIYAASLLLHAEMHTPEHGMCSLPAATAILLDAAVASDSARDLAKVASFLRHCVCVERSRKTRENTHALECGALLLNQEVLARAAHEWLEKMSRQSSEFVGLFDVHSPLQYG